MLHLKSGHVATTEGLRRILLRHKTLMAYDIHVVRHMYFITGPIGDNELIVTALSQRFEDQVEDDIVVGFDEMVTEQGIFSLSAWSADFAGGSGALGLIPTDTILFAKPYRVPYASWLVNPAVAVAANIGLEVYFDIVKVSAMEQAELVAQAGGRFPAQ